MSSPASRRGRGAPQSRDELAAAIRAEVGHATRAGFAERTFIAANVRSAVAEKHRLASVARRLHRGRHAEDNLRNCRGWHALSTTSRFANSGSIVNLILGIRDHVGGVARIWEWLVSPFVQLRSPTRPRSLAEQATTIPGKASCSRGWETPTSPRAERPPSISRRNER